MENSSEKEKDNIDKPLLNINSQKGGLKTIPFIIVNESCFAAAYTGLQPNMILYLMSEYHMEMATGSNIIFLWSAATHFFPIIGAIFADCFVGRFRIIGFGSIIGHMGTIVLWLTSIFPEARPAPCNESSSTCSSATSFHVSFLCTALGLVSIGAGGVRASSVAFGADQLRLREGQEDRGLIGKYISWYYACWTLSTLIALIFVVYIQDKMGWKVGFGVPSLLMLISVLSFFLASGLYVKLKAKSNLVGELIEVIVVSYKKRKVELLSNSDNEYYYNEGSVLVCPSENLRFLNKACVILDHQSGPSNSWSICTVDQVEALKTLIKVIPLLFTGILMKVSMAQTSVTTVQAKSMNRKLGSKFEIPAGSFNMFITLSMILWVPLYEYMIVPCASRIMGKRVHLNPKHRLGLSIVLACITMIIMAVVESIRRDIAIKRGHFDDPKAIVNMSAMWLIPQLCLSGFADSLHLIAMNEFFYMEFPQSMTSISTSMTHLGLSIANLLASFIMTSVDVISKRNGGDSWVSSNINKGHYDYYFLILACLCLVDMVLFVFFSNIYGQCKGEENASEVTTNDVFNEGLE